MIKFERFITDKNAPVRLWGLALIATLEDSSINFEIELPNNPTPQELGYVRLTIGEVTDTLRENLTLCTIGETRIEIKD